MPRYFDSSISFQSRKSNPKRSVPLEPDLHYDEHVHCRDLCGWILFPLLALSSGWILSCYHLYVGIRNFILSGILLQCFNNPNGYYTTWYGVLVLYELLFSILNIIGIILIFVLIYKKSDIVPRLLTVFFFNIGILQSVDVIWGKIALDLHNVSLRNFVPTFFSFLWLLYFKLSKKNRKLFSIPTTDALYSFGTTFKRILVCFTSIFLMNFAIFAIQEYPSHNISRKQIAEVVNSAKEHSESEIRAVRNVPRERQEVLPDGWTKITLEKYLSLQIPPTLEVRDGPYERVVNKLSEEVFKFDFKEKSFVIQQSGLNEMTPAAMRRYARILIKRVSAGQEEFQVASDQELLSASVEEIKFLDTFFYQQLQDQFELLRRRGMKTKLVKWYPLEILPWGGRVALKISYVRTVLKGKPTFVETFQIFEKNLLHSITFSYRLEEKDFWKKDFERIKKSIRFAEGKK